ncbi:hypothetical protein KP509_28G017600 [Ceratopteris richardii]|uniref:Uncharacterized protein n=1 Tax=Ceratopteris richardii TaxID=49495 RepID=A0A8T2RA07_CERRI|nr:hypothetical protein KP509_28G017600 [Ceratopteris richardii]
MDSCRQYGDDDLSMREMCSKGFESPSPLSYRDEVGNDNHNHTSLTREGWNDAAEHLLIRDDKALNSAIADQPDERRNQLNRSSPGDQLHVKSPRLPTITSTAHYASGEQTDNDLDKLVSFSSMQICKDRNVGTVASGNRLSPTNGFIDRKPDKSPSSSELSVDPTNNRLPMLRQERPTAFQQSPDPPPTPRHFKAQEVEYELSFSVPNSTADLDDGFAWLHYGRKQIGGAMSVQCMVAMLRSGRKAPQRCRALFISTIVASTAIHLALATNSILRMHMTR